MIVQGRFDPDIYEKEVVDVAAKLVPMTIALWNKVQGKMLPTPAKFHYLFNMRELSKVNAWFSRLEKLIMLAGAGAFGRSGC